MTRHLAPSLIALLLTASSTFAGYQAPPHIDGCQSRDGRFVVTARLLGTGKLGHGPNEWQVVWKDTEKGIEQEIKLEGLAKGQIYAQLFMAPDGETFALFNHITLYSSDRSNMHGPKGLAHREDSDAWRNHEAFSNRLVIYRKDGTIVKSLNAADFLQADEWSAVGRVFNRLEWLVEYEGIVWKSAVRYPYAFCRVSPDYTVLELQIKPPKSRRNEGPRAVRVSLIDGTILKPDEWPSDPEKVPVRPGNGLLAFPSPALPAWRENFVPSLDPIRRAGTLTIDGTTYALNDSQLGSILKQLSLAKKAEKDATSKAKKSSEAAIVAQVISDKAPSPNPTVKLVSGGYKKADTPGWLPNEQRLLFTDLEQGKLFRLDPPAEVSVALDNAGRGKIGPDGRFYGLIDGKLASWRPDEEPHVILEKASRGREMSLNDITVGDRGLLYFTTLKDPDRGRLSIVNIADRTVRVVFDGEDIPELANPNGVALSPDGQFLYVGISNYKNRKHSAVYRFPIGDDGSLDVEVGRKTKWAAVKAPDGVAVDPQGNVYFTAGPKIHVYNADGKSLRQIRIPKGSGTNLCFGGKNGRTLYVTTWNALYAAELSP